MRCTLVGRARTLKHLTLIGWTADGDPTDTNVLRQHDRRRVLQSNADDAGALRNDVAGSLLPHWHLGPFPTRESRCRRHRVIGVARRLGMTVSGTPRPRPMTAEPDVTRVRPVAVRVCERRSIFASTRRSEHVDATEPAGLCGDYGAGRDPGVVVVLGPDRRAGQPAPEQEQGPADRHQPLHRRRRHAQVRRHHGAGRDPGVVVVLGPDRRAGRPAPEREQGPADRHQPLHRRRRHAQVRRHHGAGRDPGVVVVLGPDRRRSASS